MVSEETVYSTTAKIMLKSYVTRTLKTMSSAFWVLDFVIRGLRERVQTTFKRMLFLCLDVVISWHSVIGRLRLP